MELSFEVVEVTPELAKKWLSNNPNNRTPKARKITRYANDMLADKWYMTGEPIKFDPSGALLDGQNRLYAVIQADKPVTMLVARGIERQAQAVMDTGVSRTAADALKMNGVKKWHMVASGAKLAVLWESGQLHTAMQQFFGDVSHAEILSWVDKHPEIQDVAEFCEGIKRHLPIKPSALVFTCWATSQVGGDDAFRFFQDLAEYKTNGRGDPRTTLLQRLTSAKRTREQTHASTEVFMIFRAWNAWRTGESLLVLKIGNKQGYYRIPPPQA